MLLDVKGVQVSYGGVRAVSNVSLKIGQGEAVCVLGANGAGKTSLLNAIMGVTAATGGINFDGKEIASWSSARRVAAGMALVPEGRRILISLTIEENLLMGAYQRRDTAKLKAELERMYGLFPNLARRRHQLGAVLSGGEQQMLAIARALMSRPKLVLMDEPSLGLSPLFVREVFKLIGELAKSGLAILLVEPNTRMALKATVRGYVLKLGELALEANTEVLRKSSELTKAYLGGEAAPPLSLTQ